MIIHDCEQGSQEWFELRAGIPTASEFKRILTPGGKLSKSQTSRTYMCRLLAEWITGKPIISEYENDVIANGRDSEPIAVQAFEFETSLKANKVGFITTDDKLIGASPDRLVGADPLEVKCPTLAVHVGYLLGFDGIDEHYKVQTQGQILVTESDKLWTCSYNAQLPTLTREVGRDEPFVRTLESALREFIDLMLESRLLLEQRFGPFERQKPKQMPADDPFGVSMADLDAIFQSWEKE